MVQLSDERKENDIISNSSQEAICIGLEKSVVKDSGLSSGPDSVPVSPKSKAADVIKYTHTPQQNSMGLISKPSLTSLEIYGNEDTNENNSSVPPSYSEIQLQLECKSFSYFFILIIDNISNYILLFEFNLIDMAWLLNQKAGGKGHFQFYKALLAKMKRHACYPVAVQNTPWQIMKILTNLRNYFLLKQYQARFPI